MFDYILQWEALKEAVSAALQISHAVLHIHLGLIVYLVAGLLLRNPFGSPVALSLVILLELANEAADFIRYQVSNWPWTPQNSASDVINTLLWPTIIYLIAWRAGKPSPVPSEVIKVE